jgi:hypothetical protein
MSLCCCWLCCERGRVRQARREEEKVGGGVLSRDTYLSRLTGRSISSMCTYLPMTLRLYDVFTNVII